MGAVTAAVIGGGAMLGSAYLGAQEAAKGRKAQERAARSAMDALNRVGIPDVEAQKIILENPQLVGEFIPEAERALELEDSLMQNISVDEALQQQQMDSLEGLGEIAEGGLTEGDKAAARDISRDVAQQDSARRQAILQNMAQRGVLGSGMELAAQLDQAQDSADRQSQESDALIQSVQNRALQALQQSGNMAGQIRQQDFGEQSRIAQAQDAINQWNTANQQNIASRNVQARNAAEAANLASRQQIENQRVANANAQEQYNKALLQQKFENEIRKAGGQGQALNNIGNIQNAAAQDRARTIGAVGSAIGNIAGAFAGMPGSAATPKTQTVAMNTATPNLYGDPTKMNA